MNSTEDTRPPSIGERYCGAAASSNLKMGERRSDVDLIIAAALTGGLGAILFRLVNEFQDRRGSIDEARRWAMAQNTKARELRALALIEKRRQDSGALMPTAKADSEFNERALTSEAEQLSISASTSVRTEYVMVLDGMATLPGARRELGEFALALWQSKHMAGSLDDLRHLLGRILDVFLDDRCFHCEGRGFNGDTRRGEKQTFCRPCENSGHRRDSIGKTDPERLFANRLLMEMNAQMSVFERNVRSNQRLVDEAKAWIAEQSGVAL